MLTDRLKNACSLENSLEIQGLIQKSPWLLNSTDNALGWTPLFRTIICGQLKAAQTLLAVGADPNLSTKLGDYPLHRACDSGNLAAAKLLLDFGANPNVQQHDGDTPLHYACRCGNTTLVELLLQYRADPHIVNYVYCRSAIDEASLKELTQILNLFEEQTAETSENYSDNDECTVSISPPSFIAKESITQRVSNFHEPNSLYFWLKHRKLEKLFNVLTENGYEDPDTLIVSAREGLLTAEKLNKIGIRKPGHQRILLAYLCQHVGDDEQDLELHWCLSGNPSSSFLPDLRNWLHALGLESLTENFLNAGFEEVEHIRFLMGGEYALSEQILEEEVKIQKVGHRHRILLGLKELTGQACSSCALL